MEGVITICEVLDDVFLDVKLFDTPDTVARTVDVICSWPKPPRYLSVRSSVEAAIEAASGRTAIVDVPNLTSDLFAKASRTIAPAIVCRPTLAANVRALNPHATIICPGVRIDGDPPHDHSGPTPMPADADIVVVGRPIIGSGDVIGAYRRYAEAAEAPRNAAPLAL